MTTENQRIVLDPIGVNISKEEEADLSSRRIEFLLPEEMDLVGGGTAVALQFAYDSPTMYV